MLGSLRKLFTQGPRPNSLSLAEDSNLAELAHNPNFITNPDRIVKLLHQVMDAPPLCSVSLNNSSEKFYTSILDIQTENNMLIIDKISPAYGNSAFLAAGDLKLTGLINGVQVSCKLKLLDPEPSGKIEHFKVQLPSYLFHPQLRTSPRIPTDSTSINFQGTIKGSNRVLKGYVTDFSRGGISINCTSFMGNLNRGDTISDCQINLANDVMLVFNLSVRTLKKVNHLGQQRQIGGYFHNLSAHDQKIMDRYISALEREHIRKLRKD